MPRKKTHRGFPDDAKYKADEERKHQAREDAMREKVCLLTNEVIKLLHELPPHERGRVLRASAVLLGCDYGNGF